MRTPDYETASEHATIAYLMARHNGASRDDADRAAVAAWDAVASGPMVEPCGRCGGTGTVGEAPNDCRRCHGIGRRSAS